VKREQAAAQESQRLATEDARQRTTAGQLSILEGFFTGKFAGSWDSERQRPSVTEGTVSDAEKSAIVSPWPTWIATAMRRAIEMAAKRSALAARLRLMLSNIRHRRDEAKKAIRSAERHIIGSVQLQAAADLRVAAAQKIEAQARSATQAADKRIADARVAEERATREAADASRAQASARAAEAATEESRRELQRAQAATKQTRTEHADLVLAKARVDQELAELSSARDRLGAAAHEIIAELPALRAERTTIEAELPALRSEHASLRQERGTWEIERNTLTAERQRFALSKRLIDEIYTDKCRIEVGGSAVRITAGPEAPDRVTQVIAKGDLEDWVPVMARMHTGLLRSLVLCDDLADTLRDRRSDLARRFPDCAVDLVEEQKAETALINKALGSPPPQQGEIGW